MTQKRTKPLSIEQLWAYEAKHPAIFAAPRALAEARLIVDLGRSQRSRRHATTAKRSLKRGELVVK
ncbi:MAG: hypothetical protein WCS94_18400 [Verrucomicrobiota bacterium]